MKLLKKIRSFVIYIKMICMDWTRLTVDNEEILYNLEGTPEEGRIVLFQNGMYFSKSQHSATIHTLTKLGNVYFYIIPRISVS